MEISESRLHIPQLIKLLDDDALDESTNAVGPIILHQMDNVNMKTIIQMFSKQLTTLK